MSNFNLTYGISKRTPVSPKVLRGILDVQTAVNRACTWSHEKLSLSAPREMGRPTFAFPFVRFGLPPATPNFLSDGHVTPAPAVSPDAFVQGTTRVRDSLWNAHVVAAFLKLVSRNSPGVLFELRDEGGFVLPGAVWIQGGNIEVNREFLNRERARVLELTGDPQAGAPFVWAEMQALAGTFFQDAAASEYADVPEIRSLGASWDQLDAMSLSEVASHVVERATKAPAPAAA